MTALQKPNQNALSLLEQSKDQIKRALPTVISSDRFVRVAITEVRKNAALQRCTPISIVSSVMQAAQLGLEFGSTLGHAYLIPYGEEATMQPGYRGLMHLARRGGEIKRFEAEKVVEGDEFRYQLGTNPDLTHIPTGKDGKVTHYYAIATHADGQKQFKVMTAEAIEEHRKKWCPRNSTTWNKSYDEMALKTVIKKLVKLLPMSPDLAQALEIDNHHDQEEETHDPEKLARVQDGQMQLNAGEEKHVYERWNAAAEAANELGVDYSDFQMGDHPPQVVLGYTVELERRITEWKKSKSESNV